VGFLIAAVTIALGIAAVSLALSRTFELAFKAPLDTQRFVDALSGLLAVEDWASARGLCDRLKPAWPARLATRALAAHAQGEGVTFTLEMTSAELRSAAHRHLYAIQMLGRIAVPLALGSAIVELGLAFQPSDAAAIAVGSAQSTLDGALRAVIIGFTTAAFCQLSVAVLQRQARARLAELRVVADLLTSQMVRTTR
jgi:hypothetical protein